MAGIVQQDHGSWKPTNFRYTISEMDDEGVSSLPFQASLLGGSVFRLLGLIAINFGDVVQMSTTQFQATKATTNLGRTVGVAVGGKTTGLSVLTATGLIGSWALCAAGQDLIIQNNGIVNVALDASGAINPGDPVIPSATTAGQVGKGSSSLVINAGATGVTSTAANGAIIGGNGVAVPVMGVALSAGTAQGDIVQILLQGLS